jgi:D-alanyl-D-alanine dipeptidase
VGAHWQSDVDAGRLVASVAIAKLHTSDRFLKQMQKAREEFAKKTKGKNWAAASKSVDPADASQFTTLAEAVPDAIMEIRYYGTYNFVGDRIDGYQEPTALLTKRAADSLRAVSDDVKAQGYRLKIYDAYRPQMGVDHFVRWAQNIGDTRMKTYFYPDLDKSVLFEQEYIYERSGHTRGSTVDLTLFDMATEKELDMGGTFDWFGPESHPDFCGNPETGQYTGDNSKSPTGRRITAEQFRHRMILRQAMMRHGFKPLSSEWWHFTLKDEPFPDTYFTFPVKQLK